MLVKNIVCKAAKILSLNDVCEYLNSDDESLYLDVKEDIENMVLAVNMVSSNIASNYIELIGKISLNNNSSILSFDSISNKSIIEIKNVFLNGKKTDFKVLPEGVKTACGDIEIFFSYFPDEVDISDEISCYTKLNELTFAQGVAGEFLFLKGAIDDAYMWDKKFKNSIFNLLRPKRNITIPQRRW